VHRSVSKFALHNPKRHSPPPTSQLYILILLLFVGIYAFFEPREELRRGLDSHTLALLLARVITLLPRLKGFVREDVIFVQRIEKLVEKF
jgi:hypothetical protein